MKALDVVLNGLMRRYSQRVSDVGKITNAMINNSVITSQSDIDNDHIAFRTLGVPNLGIQSFEKIFLHYGYTKQDYYNFEAKKLNAFWYAPPQPNYPRIFISELRVNDLSAQSQKILYEYTGHLSTDPIDAVDLNDGKAVDAFLHQPLWGLCSVSEFELLQEESEYAAWVIYNRYYLNHYTIALNRLPEGYNTVNDFNVFLEKNGIILNDSGGKIKVSKDGLLKQSSTVSQMVEAQFLGGETKMISGSYIEFCERKLLPEFSHLDKLLLKRHHFREGFEASNADKIFESTYSKQTNKRKL